jgi:hypothetical protein
MRLLAQRIYRSSLKYEIVFLIKIIQNHEKIFNHINCVIRH